MNVHVHPSWVQAEVLPTSSFHSGGAAFNFSPGEEWHFILNPCPPFTHEKPASSSAPAAVSCKWGVTGSPFLTAPGKLTLSHLLRNGMAQTVQLAEPPSSHVF